MFGEAPQTRLKRFKSLLCDAYVVVKCFNKSNRGFGDPLAICIDETFVITQTCKTSNHGNSLCAFRRANKSIKRVVSFCHCRSPLCSLPFRAVTVLRKTISLKTRRLIPHEKKFLQEFFSKNAKKVLRGIRAKLSSLAQFLLTRLRRFAIMLIFHHIHPYLFYLLDVILYH